MISYTCPHCASALNIPDKYAGQRGICKKCGNTIEVPSSDSASTRVRSISTDSAAVVAHPKHLCQKCGGEMRRLSRDVESEPAVEAMVCLACDTVPGTCPMCGATLDRPDKPRCNQCNANWWKVLRADDIIESVEEKSPIPSGNMFIYRCIAFSCAAAVEIGAIALVLGGVYLSSKFELSLVREEGSVSGLTPTQAQLVAWILAIMTIGFMTQASRMTYNGVVNYLAESYRRRHPGDAQSFTSPNGRARS